MGFLQSIFKATEKTDFKKMVADGAVIVDVRSAGEFASGHIPGSVNIPLEQLSFRADELEGKKVITCCRSGNRSGIALHILGESGIEATNGGAWDSLLEKLR
ncbi:MAG: rhodanese-like domain-containing protein [Chitinophagaceae bacterium]